MKRDTAFVEEVENRQSDKSDDQADRSGRLEALAESLLKKRREAIEGRITSGIERIWREDEDALEGRDDTNRALSMLDYATKEAPLQPPVQNTEPARSTVVVNVVRSKCEMAEGRFSDILLPVDDRNWGLKVTPVPELAMELKDTRLAVKTDGSPLINPETENRATNADVAKAKKEKAKDQMKLMEQEVDDQLTETDYNGESRKLIKESIRMGTGILKGPNVVKRLKKAWIPKSDGERTVHVLKIDENMQPASKSVDPWNVYPDPHCGEDPKKGSYIWERDFILPREVRQLIGVDGYEQDQLLKVLEDAPLRLNVATTKPKGLEVKFEAVEKGKAYERWEYYGDVDRDDLEYMGVDCSQFDEKFQSLSGAVLFINDRPVKVILNTLDTGDMPYDFFQWSTVKGSPWGMGIPRILIYLSRIIIAAWRAIMDNAGDSAGANIIIGSGIEPADGKWEITGRKIWRVTSDDVDDVKKAFNQFQIANYQDNLQAIIKLALEFVDMETSLPMIFQGEQGEPPETLGATNIMVDANNVGLRPRVKLYDDNITRPHLTRYYHWNMQYNDRSEIKGDYQVDARGTSVLLAKDQMVQTLVPILKLRDDELFKGMIDWVKAIKKLLSAQRLDILKPEEEIKAWIETLKNKKPPIDPRIQGNIDIATIRAEADLQKVEAQSKHDIDKLTLQEQIAERDRTLDILLKQMDYQIKMMEYAEKRDINLDKVKADLAKAAQELNLQEKLATSNLKGPQVKEPPIEPAGRAEEGRAYPD